MKSLRFPLLTALLATGWTIAVAQQPVVYYADTIRIEPGRQPSRWVVNLAPLALFDPENTVQLGLERLLAGRYALLGEFGYGPAGLNVWRSVWHYSNANPVHETWRGRAEWRMYTRRVYTNRRGYPGNTYVVRPLGNYVALDLYYKQTNASETGSVGRDCQSGTCQYYQRFQSRVVKYVGAAHVKIGKQVNLYIPNQHGRIVMDLYMGAGLRRRVIEHYGLPQPEDAGSYSFDDRSGVFNERNSFFSGLARTGFIFDITAGFRVGYVF